MPRARDIVRAAFPRATPILPGLNQFANVIGRAKGESQEILLVHPVWPAAAWWSQVTEACVRFVELPPRG